VLGHQGSSVGQNNINPDMRISMSNPYIPKRNYQSYGINAGDNVILGQGNGPRVGAGSGVNLRD